MRNPKLAKFLEVTAWILFLPLMFFSIFPLVLTQNNEDYAEYESHALIFGYMVGTAFVGLMTIGAFRNKEEPRFAIPGGIVCAILTMVGLSMVFVETLRLLAQ